MLVKVITYCGQRSSIICDGKCEKAWGRSSRPTALYCGGAAPVSEYLADDEFDKAPIDPETYEGVDGKPQDYNDPKRQNRWCARECERSILHQEGEVVLPDWTKRQLEECG